MIIVKCGFYTLDLNRSLFFLKLNFMAAKSTTQSNTEI